MLLCQYKLHMKPTRSLYSGTQQCQMHKIFVFYVFYCNLKEKRYIRRIKNIDKRNNYMWNQYYSILAYWKLESVGPVQEEIKLPLPNEKILMKQP